MIYVSKYSYSHFLCIENKLIYVTTIKQNLYLTYIIYYSNSYLSYFLTYHEYNSTHPNHYRTLRETHNIPRLPT